MAIRIEINPNEHGNLEVCFFFFFFSKQNVVYFNIWMYIFNNKSVNIINNETVGESDIKMPSVDKTLA